MTTCPTCGGAGQVQSVQRTRFGQLVRTAACQTCGGDGRVAAQPCGVC
ncbi:MAG: zinc finger domain-containing protein, partial [Cellulosimicrobium cellulans]